MPVDNKVKVDIPQDGEQLKCNCENADNHQAYLDQNDEIVVECTECERFIKLPKQE